MSAGSIQRETMTSYDCALPLALVLLPCLAQYHTRLSSTTVAAYRA